MRLLIRRVLCVFYSTRRLLLKRLSPTAFPCLSSTTRPRSARTRYLFGSNLFRRKPLFALVFTVNIQPCIILSLFYYCLFNHQRCASPHHAFSLFARVTDGDTYRYITRVGLGWIWLCRLVYSISNDYAKHNHQSKEYVFFFFFF
jgi:hypothetical protein